MTTALEIAGLAEKEIQVLGDLEGQEILRVVEQRALQAVGRLVPVAGRPRARRPQMEDLALPERAAGVLERHQDLLRRAHPLGRRAVQREIGPQDVPEHQAAVRRHRRLDRRHRLAVQRQEALDRFIEEGDARTRCRFAAARPSGPSCLRSPLLLSAFVVPHHTAR